MSSEEWELTVQKLRWCVEGREGQRSWIKFLVSGDLSGKGPWAIYAMNPMDAKECLRKLKSTGTEPRNERSE